MTTISSRFVRSARYAHADQLNRPPPGSPPRPPLSLEIDERGRVKANNVRTGQYDWIPTFRPERLWQK